MFQMVLKASVSKQDKAKDYSQVSTKATDQGKNWFENLTQKIQEGVGPKNLPIRDKKVSSSANIMVPFSFLSYNKHNSTKSG